MPPIERTVLIDKLGNTLDKNHLKDVKVVCHRSSTINLIEKHDVKYQLSLKIEKTLPKGEYSNQ